MGERLEAGMVDEIRDLLGLNGERSDGKRALTAEELMYYGLEYKYITLYVMGKLTYDDMFNQLNIAIRQFAKRQMTWFRGMERRGIKLHWLDAAQSTENKSHIIAEWWKDGKD